MSRISQLALGKLVVPFSSNLTVDSQINATSIWLKDVSRELEASSQIQRYYYGFDISPDQFPADSGQIQFSVHDITKPFPKEYLNRYDLVHVRLLVAAIDESDYQAVIANVQSILSKFPKFGPSILHTAAFGVLKITLLQNRGAISNGKKLTKKPTLHTTTR